MREIDAIRILRQALVDMVGSDNDAELESMRSVLLALTRVDVSTELSAIEAILLTGEFR